MNLNIKGYLASDLIKIIIFLLSICYLSYGIADREQIFEFWLGTAIAFACYFILINDKHLSVRLIFRTSIFIRFLILFSFPILSDDVYRFIWDGQLLHQGMNPFGYKPSDLVQNPTSWLDMFLFNNMNSPDYYSVYPPVNQLAFYLSAISGKGNLLASIVILRSFILLFDVGNIILIKKLLNHYQKDERLVFLYALNPLVIIEFTGNLHFEAVMIFFTLLFIWMLLKNRWILAAISLALAICSKLLPIIFIPLMIKKVGLKKTIFIGLITGSVCLLLFLPFLHTEKLWMNFRESLNLYYGKFEFNGSFYQLFRAIGWEIYNYNPIAKTSKLLIALTLIGFIITYIKSKNLFEGIFWLIFIYNIFGAIVHPWYILFLVALSPFVKWRFGMVWSLLICLSYYTYSTQPYQESMALVMVEYGLLGVFLIYEAWDSSKTQKLKTTL
ncbi:polyprenol phosphomannose-dependent alpha 1,6 mannosyltransferase MptB [Pedobacter glucosidilyticus]|uniref:polyprenol phosphomannose-dependent alpha 1,6 mannosyltransferase MptB n=1 Tax=Pedobacter glucosidilyticus TaxID=1122941 RepID=UPI0026EE8448|nr:polyprenol phosphomannose-dependent alpha 1,6 mannosyltransferase MptB [Pedobacter glucosidilyticus]